MEYKGGKCEICGYNKCVSALEFHHKNPLEKDFGIGAKGYTRSIEKNKKEVDKCNLDMKIVDAEFPFDNSKVIIYFTAPSRIDFRDLVKSLAT